MTDIRIQKLADLLVNYSVGVKPGEKVFINASALAEPLVKEVYVKVLEAKGNPFPIVALPGLEELLYRYGSDAQLQYVPEPFKLIMETYDVRISLGGSANTKALNNINPDRIVIRDQAFAGIMQTFMQRSAAGKLRWVGTLFPTHAFAQDAGMSLTEYEEFVYAACMPDFNDPIAYWQRFATRQQKIVDWLKGKRSVHLTGPETDLTLSIEGRTFINACGHHNMPDGEVFTGPVENSVNGHVRFSYPTIYQGREVNGVNLTLSQGKVIAASAATNQEFLLKTLDTDPGARYVGEFAIGTNEGITQFTRQILYDEKFGGSFHMALGAGYPDTGSKNQSAIHWDMICDLRNGGEIRVDGELLYQNGKFVIGY
jgi:aminopeptidase